MFLMFIIKASAKNWDGPMLGPKMATKNEREFTEEQIRAGRDSHIGLQAGYNKGATQSGINMGNTRHIVD
ncbi:TAGLN3 [Bugula neritina]|uniref:TAGLN3 n=1 Tax=Bugula neritina TaxID=10212 RepID=A0A7J7IVI2_BUGNE|nr:TAGLN3 [Bugula neritina]